MYAVVGIYFEKANTLEYYAPNTTSLTIGQYVVVESKRGHELGVVRHASREVSEQDVTLPLKPVLRIATEADLIQYEKNEVDATRAADMCKGFVEQLGLEMCVVNCEYILDRSKIIFNFTADERIDFRKLVRMLAQRLKTRIELRQIGVRDEAKLLGGIGPCGRSLCCATFLGDFEPVSIKMAKDQNLSLNPTKISGACGRLMCCLKFENDFYESAREQLPDIGTRIQTPEGHGEVVSLNIIDVSMQVRLDGMEQLMEYHIEELETLK
ncbi:stage 0 sporulation family protein [Staphylococcus pseudintermedius]|uniref:Signal peptidase II n=1 Tax=Staphylococcus pseudintermedius TaxID=283734 RepID=A0A8H9BXQ9_STAPS|nr:stage 0 sporulation family protein [Staphylococcus pseudintermedius]ASQ51523.1 signal peptidase II [Staphylococcus pseudintermedius]EGQ0309575.1 stage 0 sporulation family protein [Staphylococcus pseudintermedius]EGQ0318616.1 stage 0 sporulation family protein [Staphylococcus pseudintermedius]EGQ0360696.1 stage 0 sporulation family protein [Staphylococcus pseudintermedius]EGQ0364540.1 stage 0 sporulation family protein [Staphylococcus pseudintermedius]